MILTVDSLSSIHTYCGGGERRKNSFSLRNKRKKIEESGGKKLTDKGSCYDLSFVTSSRTNLHNGQSKSARLIWRWPRIPTARAARPDSSCSSWSNLPREIRILTWKLIRPKSMSRNRRLEGKLARAYIQAEHMTRDSQWFFVHDIHPKISDRTIPPSSIVRFRYWSQFRSGFRMVEIALPEESFQGLINPFMRGELISVHLFSSAPEFYAACDMNVPRHVAQNG